MFNQGHRSNTLLTTLRTCQHILTDEASVFKQAHGFFRNVHRLIDDSSLGLELSKAFWRVKVRVSINAHAVTTSE
ncbi:hypothetical protein AC579_7792 [Pseudocercospora musae]|uniref:Uncharacterized protein n=1 Tax=Pseudocercospora musae TaxID=113226 RepID=A0A139IJ32_9PEZI|nr:hypothetical protein AC579_7792 [Pseudocercospora musae]